MYHIFVRDWLNVFPREQIFIMKTEDMTPSNMRSIYRHICRFLDISELDKNDRIPEFDFCNSSYSSESCKMYVQFTMPLNEPFYNIN